MRFVRRHETDRTQARFEKAALAKEKSHLLAQEGASSNSEALARRFDSLQLSVGASTYIMTYLYGIVVTAPHHEPVRNRPYPVAVAAIAGIA